MGAKIGQQRAAGRSLCGVAILSLTAASSLALAAPANAKSTAAATEAAALKAQLDRLDGELHAQRTLIEQQGATIAAQQREIEMLKGNLELAGMRGAGVPDARAANVELPQQPVGEAPTEPNPEEQAEVQAIPREQGVLTPAGQLVLDPSLEYDRASSNRLVFRGIELIPGIQIGLIEASNADRDTLVGTASLRYGITDRLEIEGRLPYLYRHDTIDVVQHRDQEIVRSIDLKGHGIGDAEATLRYQINALRPLKPIWIASLRVKSRTGEGPFEIPFDEFGVAEGLATGSGFWGVQPGLSFLLPSDPVVLYGGLSYFHQFARDIDRVIGDTPIGRVEPGGAINANIGFGFALNPRFSYSLGYRHTYIFPTSSEIGDTIQRSARLQAGSLLFGMSYRVTQRRTVNLGFEFGMTKDAPDLAVIVRMPVVLIH